MIIWDFETRALYAKLVLHRNSVEAVSFTYNDKYLVSLGGQDDARCQQCQSHLCTVCLGLQVKYKALASALVTAILQFY